MFLYLLKKSRPNLQICSAIHRNLKIASFPSLRATHIQRKAKENSFPLKCKRIFGYPGQTLL